MNILHKISATSFLIGLIMAMAAWQAAPVSAQDSCPTTPGPHPSLELNSYCILNGVTVTGDVTMTGATLALSNGTVVEGNVTQIGDGGINITGSTVLGTITEMGQGQILVGDYSTVNHISEEGDDGVRVFNLQQRSQHRRDRPW